MALSQQVTEKTVSSSHKVCMVGLGYIGLPTASLLAKNDVFVHGVDVNQAAVDTVNGGGIHIYEPGLEELVRAVVRQGLLVASVQPAQADTFVLAVPTPFKEGHAPDISYVEAATRAIAPFVRPGNLIILESTSPVGTTEQVASWLREERPDLLIPQRFEGELGLDQVYIAYCPERVLPGRILHELVANDRVVGGIDNTSAQVAKGFYGRFVEGRILTTDSRTAEMCKLTENSFRDVNIAFANELSLICERLEIDVWELIALANRHPRVNILRPGPGVGGHCIAVDPWFIVHAAPDEAVLIRAARSVNDGKPHHVVATVMEKASRLKRPVIACLGLAFKADIDDLRESPAVEITSALAMHGSADILAVEPHIRALPPSLATKSNVRLVDLDEALGVADILVLLVDHAAFAKIDRELLLSKMIVDTRGIWR